MTEIRHALLRWLPALLVAGLLLWWMRRTAAPDAPAAVLGALHQASLTSVERITVYPIVPGPQGKAPRPFQLREARQLQRLLPGLRQLRPLVVDTTTFQPLLEATVVVRLAPALIEAWHLHGRDIVLRLAAADTTDVVLRAQSRQVLSAPLLNRGVRLLRDSLER